MPIQVSETTGTGGNGPSPGIWGDCPWQQIVENGHPYIWDDFLRGNTETASDLTYNCYMDTGVVFSQVVADAGGVSGFSGADADNDAGLVQSAPIGLIVSTGKPFWFEARVRCSTVTADKMSIAFGLIEGDMDAATGTVQTINTGALTDENWIAFYRTGTTETTGLHFGWKADGQTAQAFTTAPGTLAAATWIKAGFKFNPDAPTAERITVYINGVKITAQYVTGANMDAATFPDDVPLGLFIAQKVTAGSLTDTFDIDWWRAATLRA